MKQALVQVPMPIGVDSETDEFMFYKSGVFNFKGCGDDVDHAVLAVGYVEPYSRWVDGRYINYPGYWIIKNSFGKSWGEAGYIRI
jgi:C1A family cysteine protease